MRTGVLSLLLLVLVPAGCAHKDLLITGVDRTRYPEAASAREAFEQYREFMRAENFQAAYRLLSQESRDRYGWIEYKLTFQKTRFGSMLRYLYTEWDVKGVKLAPDGERAEVVLTHYLIPDHDKPVVMVKEDFEGRRVWRVLFRLSDTIGMPEADERMLFPESFGGGGSSASAGRTGGGAPAAHGVPEFGGRGPARRPR